MDKKIEKDIINCSRCGLCMAVCPAYEAKKTEGASTRGKFLQLLGIIKGELKYDKNIASSLDLCLNCGRCLKNCPSGINAVEIFAKIKEENLTFFEKLLYSAFIFKVKMFALRLFYGFKHPFKRKKKNDFQNGKILYFKGCATKAMGLGFEGAREPFVCCGLPFYTKGRLYIYEKNKNKNLEIIKKADKVVFDCATCFDTVLNYEGVEKEKLIYFTDFYKSLNLASNKPLRVVFHKPCHLSEEKYEEITEILKNIKNVDFIEFEGAKDCCGFGGDFFTRHPKTASKLAFQKIKNALISKPDIILTTCPICLWGLKYGIIKTKSKILALDLSDFLSDLTV